MTYKELYKDTLAQENLLLKFLQSKQHSGWEAKQLVVEIASLIAKRKGLQELTPAQLGRTVELSTIEIPSTL